MADRTEHVYPVAPANQTPKSDTESAANSQSKELKRKKRMKCYISMAVFAVFQIAMMLIFSLVIMKVKTPKLRLAHVTVNNISTSGADQASPSFNMSIIGHVRVKNTNFGSYKYEPGMLVFKYGDVIVGEQSIPKASAKALSTKKVDLLGNLDSEVAGFNSSSTASQLGNDISSGSLKLSSFSKLYGEVKILLIVKKKKTAFMNCSMNVNLITKAVQDLECE